MVVKRSYIFRQQNCSCPTLATSWEGRESFVKDSSGGATKAGGKEEENRRWTGSVEKAIGMSLRGRQGCWGQATGYYSFVESQESEMIQWHVIHRFSETEFYMIWKWIIDGYTVNCNCPTSLIVSNQGVFF